jgi:hypothetical protein
LTYSSIDALRESLGAPAKKARDPAYVKKMIHPVPQAATVDRAQFVLARATGKAVLHVGASGELHAAMLRVAARVHGLDLNGNGAEIVGVDLDNVHGSPPKFDGIDLVVCGEVLEHLGNPLNLLRHLRADYPGVPVIVTVPNAFSDIARKHMERDDVENVNVDHVAWYSWRTLKTLVERAGYAVAEHHWYGHGKPGLTEGLVFVLE